ncbi:WhiB family transcriptional regulator, redox-sensing transcriptional regulator [Amycolatopsis sacchari]|uniref:Transcriptional regulator WhiB n=1 Tax=Amycolatopsis sacchari TaxID=115433 RepID=A0A1I4A9A3_9PSEU|nr:WhiB family transcriptional regulator [Amycolatopsis sacchari]SFK52359.1 WhiB family transcriptional regulator, redox-sensing transcriptional regulator [Amycolatopsis sacchari]
MPTPRPKTTLTGATHGRGRPTAPSWADVGLTPEALAWHADAACLGTDPEAFFPEPEAGYAVTVAKRVCGHCPVRAACLDYALARREPFGIWGGHTTQDRRRLLRHRQQADAA